MVEPSEAGEQGGKAENAEDVGHVELNKPAKPMNARDRLPAMMRTSAVPLARSGMSASSLLSRIEAMSTSASVRPSPAPIAKNNPCRNP